MKATDYEKLVDELNEKVYNKKTNYFDNSGLYFRFVYDGYTFGIALGDQILFYEDTDREYNDETNKEIPVRLTVIKKFNEYVAALKTIKL